MQKLFSVVRFALFMTLAVFVGLSTHRPSYYSFVLVCCALICFILFGAISHFVAYRRLCWRLGVAHEIWANADRFENLRFMRWETFPYWALARWREPTYALYIVRGFFGTLRGWWVLQTIYEACLAILLIAGMTCTFFQEAFNWSCAPAFVAAVVILVCNRALTVCEPIKFCPQN